MIVCLRTVGVPAEERARYLAALAAGPDTFPTEETRP